MYTKAHFFGLGSLRALFALNLFSAVTVVVGQVQVVDMIPAAMSNETEGNPECFIAVNPDNPQTIAATSFMTTPAGSSNGQLLVSFDGGSTWVERNVIPSAPGNFNSFDITIGFNSAGTAFYAGYIRNPTFNLEISRTTDLTFNTPLTVLNSPRSTDQPYIAVRTVTGWFDFGNDRIWTSNNDGAANPASATIDQTLDAANAAPVFSQIRMDVGTPVGRDNYQTRTVSHADGHIYAAFYRRKGTITGGYNADVVVVRDDNWGNSTPAFRNLVDSATMVAGQNVVTSTPVEDTAGSSSALGNDWWGGDLSITVEPNDSSRVYISYQDSKAGAPKTDHLRRSTDFGQTWGPDLLAVPLAKNSSIAVNSHGKIAYLYQQLSGPPPNYHWQTHLRRSADGTTWDDVTLADFPAVGPGSLAGSRILGDYARVVAVGQNFYGVFSSYNDLVNASFPAGVTWQRNKTPNGAASPHFLAVDGVTTVASSIDPFFFKTTEVSSTSDFYVRDWTDSAAVRDHGQEPSVRGNFYSTSDVWNRRSNDPAAFDANDNPQVEDPQPAAMGHNFAFARISRETAGSAADVTVQYLYSDGGVGVPYVSAGPATTVHFAAGDTQQTPTAGNGLQWDLPSGASNHVCLAVEISTPTDPILQPGLLGRAPGWPTTDLLVVNDNNKAQRNMQVFGFGGMTQGMMMYAIAHNAATFMRDMSIGIAVDPRDLARLGSPTIRAIGGIGSASLPVQPGAVLTLSKMAPGENRWIELTFSPTSLASGSAPVDIVELVNGVPVNGYAFMPTPIPIQDAILNTLRQHAAIFTRLDNMFNNLSGAQDQARQALDLIKNNKTISPALYTNFLKAQSKSIVSLTNGFLKNASDGDSFGIIQSLDRLVAAISNPSAAQPLHLVFLEKLGAAQTLHQKAQGDVADIPQNVRWQKELFGRLKGVRCAGTVVEESSEFLAKFERGRADADDFEDLLESLENAFEEAAQKYLGRHGDSLLDDLEKAKSPAALQKAHRAFLLALDAAAPK